MMVSSRGVRDREEGLGIGVWGLGSERFVSRPEAQSQKPEARSLFSRFAPGPSGVTMGGLGLPPVVDVLKKGTWP